VFGGGGGGEMPFHEGGAGDEGDVVEVVDLRLLESGLDNSRQWTHFEVQFKLWLRYKLACLIARLRRIGGRTNSA
jgi:hypothetical protein